MSDVTRRELFSFWRRGKPEPEREREPDPAPEPVRDPLRPPGAVFETIFVGKCQRSGECIEACPRQAIFALDEAWGRSAGTPAIVARSAPCVVCEGLQCTKACPSGALVKLGVMDVQMGTAVVYDSCVTYAGETCAACVTSCPVPGAIAVGPKSHPVVDAGRCIGCGVCEHVCPTAPASIVITPARDIAR
jgi:MauM/NapG family ferredoxin protein